MAVTTYHARVERGERFWLVHIPKLGRTTQARHLREVERMARDLVAVMLDVEPDSFDLTIHVDLPESVRRHVDEAARLRNEASAASTAAAAEARAAARELAAAGLPVRDIGVALNISHQRVHQLIRS